VAENNEDEIADVGGEENVIRRVPFDVSRKLRARDVRRRVPIQLVCAMPKLRVHGGKDLLRGWRSHWQRESVCIVKLAVVLVEHGILG
jgi:hypothetical protein